MLLIESLITGIGSTIAKATLQLWLGENEIADTASASVSDILSKKVPDFLRRNKTERTFENIRDLSADSIAKMLTKDAEGIAVERLEIIANAASETLSNTHIDGKILVSRNLDKDQILTYLLKRTGAQGGSPALAGNSSGSEIFSSAEQVIYRRVLSHASQLIVDMSSSFPQFEVDVSGELLQRTESLAKQVIEGMNRIVTEQGDAFETDYRNACVRRWDQLELFGVDLKETSKRYNLSIAYVTLMIEQLSGESSATDDESGIRDAMQAHEALAKFNRLFVRGPAGSGKTTLMQWFAVFGAARRLEGDLAELNDCVPFLIKLRNFSDGDFPRPEDFPKEASTAIAGAIPDRWVHEKLKTGKALIMVDGLDEVAETRRKDVRQWLNDLTESFPKSRFLITSRPHAAEEGWLNADQFIDAELQDMGRSEIDEFIDHWHEAVAESIRDEKEKSEHLGLAESLKLKLGKNAAIFRLATSPLLCALLCALHRQRVQNLPSDRIELYSLCIDMFMRRDEERKIDPTDYVELSNRQKESLLQNFAWWMIRNEKTTATPAETTECFQRHVDRLTQKPEDCDGEAVTKLFMQRIGIIRQLAHQKIDFPHRTFQEYLAAKAAVEEDDLGILVKNAHDDQWREVVILAAGVLSPKRASNLITDLLERGDSDKEYHSLYLVAVAALDLLVSGEENSKVESEVAKRLNKIVPPKTITAAKQLAVAGDLVVPHLKYRKMNVKEAAASVRTLALIGSESAHNTIKAYGADSRNGVRESIIQSTASARNPDQYLRHAFSTVTNLKSLNLSKTQISDLSSLSHFINLTSLDIERTQVSDINSLSHLTELTSLNIIDTPVRDISGLNKLDNLVSLKIGSTQLDMATFPQLTNLRALVLQGIQVCASDLISLSNLEDLTLYNAQISNMPSLAKLTNLENISISDTSLCDIKHLSDMKNIRSLTLLHTQVNDISHLTKLTDLEKLEIYDSPLSDISCLKKLTNLKFIVLINTQVNDVSARFLNDIDGLRFFKRNY